MEDSNNLLKLSSSAKSIGGSFSTSSQNSKSDSKMLSHRKTTVTKKLDEPEYEDLKLREQKMKDNEEISDMNDSDLDIEFDEQARPKECIFAELERG